MKRRIALLLAIMLLAAAGCAAEDIASRAAALRETVLSAPYGLQALNADGAFAPIPMRAAEFDNGDEALLRRLGVDDVQDAKIGRRTWTHTSEQGIRTTACFCGTYGEHVFLFEQRPGEEEKLIDVLFGASIDMGMPRVMELRGGRYLLTTTWGHGTGCHRLWTNYYNLDTRRMELSLVREGFEGEGTLYAHAITRTNLDDPQDVQPDGQSETLIAYIYTTVSEMDGSSCRVLDDDCTVRVYESRDGGLLLVGERVFDEYTSALLEQASAGELLDPAWGMGAAQDELLDTSEAQAAQPDAYALLEAVAPALRRAKVVGADYVNIRQQGSKQSPVIAAANEGEHVYILAENQGFENGWTQVLYLPPEGAADAQPTIGYIWWSFLQEK